MSDECGAGIAVVEDERALVDVLLRLFAKRGIRVCFVAYDGGEAILKFIKSTPKPHIVLMDYRMPTVNGIDATIEIMKIDPETRIIFLSADIDVKEDALKAGVKIFLKKPASIKDIDNAIREIVKTIPGLKLIYNN
jgi:two-component system, chemotaxis family, chemotaxis protein CheY